MKKYNLIFSLEEVVLPTRHLMPDYMYWRYGIQTTPEDWLKDEPLSLTINKFRSDKPLSQQKIYSDFARGFFYYFKKRDFELTKGARETIKEMSSFFNIYLLATRAKDEKVPILEILKKERVVNYIDGLYCTGYQIHSKKDHMRSSFLDILKGYNLGYTDTSEEEVKNSLGKALVPVLFCQHRQNDKPSFKQYEEARGWDDLKRLFLLKTNTRN